MTTAPIVRAAWVNRSQADAFSIFTEEIGAWWPLPTHGLFGTSAGAVHFRGGKLIEQSTDGSESVWAEVQSWDPPNRLVISWHPGHEASDASEVEVLFEDHDGGTRVVIEHRGWEAFGADALRRRTSYVGPNAWGYVLDHFADGAEVGADAIDVAPLMGAYDTFFSEADRGGFGPAPEGEWNAEQVVAHVGLNDSAMIAVSQSLIHRNPSRFDNELCQDPDVLARWIESCGSMDELIARGRALSRQAMSVLQRLDPEQRQTPVDCRFLDGGETAFEQPMPWVSVAAEIQATRHLPGHSDQLRRLRR
ncbi:MAG: SRPBCC domain-containing protein [Acidimicrobiia bacterium]|nr:SRPBCC domain-containing protein [Acidimicrobiia bacterium]